MQMRISSLSELDQFSKKFLKSLRGGEVIALQGILGAGKTAFSKKLLKNAGVKRTVVSPTFVLMLPYQTGKKTFYHLDLYRLKGFKEVAALGILDLWEKPENIFLIEWAEKIKTHLPKNTIYLKLMAKLRMK